MEPRMKELGLDKFVPSEVGAIRMDHICEHGPRCGHTVDMRAMIMSCFVLSHHVRESITAFDLNDLACKKLLDTSIYILDRCAN